MTELTLARMRWWDVEDSAALEQSLFADPWSTEQFLSELAHVPETRWYQVARDATGMVGYVGLRAVGADADVQTLAVADRAQGHGLGGSLLDALLAEAAGRGCARAFLEVRADNRPAMRLYESRGFERSGVRPAYYGPGQDAVIMTTEVAPR